METTENEKAEGINLLSPEVKIPVSLKEEIKAGTQKVVEAIKKEKPDLIIFLQRSGSLFKPAVEAALEEEHPPVIEANIGREISSEYTNEKIEGNEIFLEGKEGEPVDLSKLIENHKEDYEEWLKAGGDERIKPFLADIVARIKENARNTKVEKVLVVDDLVFDGNTLRFTAPIIIKVALGEGITITSEVVLRNQRWVSLILQETFGSLTDAEEHFFAELMKGYLEAIELQKSPGLSRAIERQTSQGNLIKIETSEHLQFLGVHIQESFKEEGREAENPFLTLKERFNEEFLIGFSEKVREAFKKTSEKKDLG